MSYTIDERNVERQHMLAQVLNPLTRGVLERIPKITGGRCLDLGCGQGNTTRLLSEVLEPGECIGVEYDASLVEYANARGGNPPGVRFQRGDAMKLDFPDASFDVVFARYLLVHMPDPMAVIREMLRVVRPGGHVIAYEPDCHTLEIAYPASSVPAFMNRAWAGLFAEPQMGRKLVAYFRMAGATNLQAGALLNMEYNSIVLKRTYRMTLESLEVAGIAKGLFTREQYFQTLEDLRRMESDPLAMLTKFPDMWVVAAM